MDARACSPRACNRTEHRVPNRRAPCLSAPRQPVSPITASTLSGAPQLIYPKLDRSLVTAFPSPATASAFADSILGSMVPACYFAVSLTGRNARSAFRLRRRNWFAPIPAASTPQTRRTLTGQLIRLLSPSPLPSRNFRSFGIKAFNGRSRRPVRRPNPPDFRSLLATVLFLEEGYGSSSAVRYVSGGLPEIRNRYPRPGAGCR